jgi:hypothetical protein
MLKVKLLLASADGSFRPTPRAGVGARALTAHRQATSMPQTAIRSDIHQSLDVHRHFTPEIALDAEFLVDDLAQAIDFIVSQVADARIRVDPSALQQILAGVKPNPVNVGQPDYNALLAWEVNT